MRSTTSQLPKRPTKQIYLKAATAALLAGLVTIVLVYGTFYLSRGAQRNDGWADLGAAIIAIILAGPYLLAANIMLMRLFRVPNWAGVGTIVAVTVAAVAWFDMSQFENSFVSSYKLAVLVALLPLMAVLTVWVYWWVPTKRPGSTTMAKFLICFALVVGGTAGLGRLVYMAVARSQAGANRAAEAQARANDVRTLRARLAKLGFSVYLPTTLPNGYSLKSIVPTNAFTPNLQNLTLQTNRTVAPPDLVVYEVAALATFKPSSGDCGPYDATAFIAEPAGYPLPCQLLLSVNGVPVYVHDNAVTTPSEHGYYLQTGSTEIMLEAIDGTLSNDAVQTIVEGLQLTATSALPTGLLQPY
ncbi:MAG TPA: hypothetical protein VLF69_04185 [Candidatus Saccharimonadales bacterium]|nr:hypothetical protein [Candidatus Saccharimonadales bacterium]